MKRIATTLEAAQEIRRVLEYVQQPNPSRDVLAKELCSIADRVGAKKKLKYTDEWIEKALNQSPFGSYKTLQDQKEELIAAAKERGIQIASVAEFNEVRKRLQEYLDKKKKTAAANKKFDAYIALAADDVKKLRKSDVYRVLSEAKSAKELESLAAYIIKGNSDLRSTVEEDVPDVKDEKGWA